MRLTQSRTSSPNSWYYLPKKNTNVRKLIANANLACSSPLRTVNTRNPNSHQHKCYCQGIPMIRLDTAKLALLIDWGALIRSN